MFVDHRQSLTPPSMLTSSPLPSPTIPPPQKQKSKPIIATPQTSHALNKSHRLLRPLKSKLLSLENFYSTHPSLHRDSTIWRPKYWPPTSRSAPKSYGGRRSRTKCTNVAVEGEMKPVW